MSYIAGWLDIRCPACGEPVIVPVEVETVAVWDNTTTRQRKVQVSYNKIANVEHSCSFVAPIKTSSADTR